MLAAESRTGQQAVKGLLSVDFPQSFIRLCTEITEEFSALVKTNFPNLITESQKHIKLFPFSLISRIDASEIFFLPKLLHLLQVSNFFFLTKIFFNHLISIIRYLL